MCEHVIKCKSFPLEVYFTVQNNTCNHPQSSSQTTGHRTAPEKPHSCLAGGREHNKVLKRRLGCVQHAGTISEAEQ